MNCPETQTVAKAVQRSMTDDPQNRNKRKIISEEHEVDDEHKSRMIVIDGSMLEGGGQILRNAAALAAITGTTVRIHSIRAKRSNPGLRPQHLTGLQLVQNLSQGDFAGASVGSKEVVLVPGQLRCQDATGDTKTAGSCVLLAQTALPCLLFARSAGPHKSNRSLLTLLGGTDAAMAPPIGYMQHVFLPTLQRTMGIKAHAELHRRGFYPKGGGRVQLQVAALPSGHFLPGITLMERGEIAHIVVYSYTAGKVQPGVGQRMAVAAEAVLKKRLAADIVVQKEITHEPPARAVGDGCGVVVTATTTHGCVLGGSALGERGVTAEIVGSNAADSLADILDCPEACVDDWMMDQLVIFMALARGKSSVKGREPSLHARTAMAVAEALTPAVFACAKEDETGTWVVRCSGMGLEGKAEGDASEDEEGHEDPGGMG